MQDLKIELLQTNQFWEDKLANFNHIETTFFSNINKNETDLILLPEMFNTSFSMQVEKLGEEMDGESITWLINWAKRLNCCIGGSLIIHENGHYYNRFIIVSKNGIETQYDKRHLFRMAGEKNHFTAGDDRVIFHLKGWKLMLQVCYDLRFPVFARNKVINGEKEYDALIYIANWPKKRAFIWKNLIQARAIENQAYCIGINRIGEDGNQIKYTGDSLIVDPWGKIIKQIEPSIEKRVSVTIRKETLAEIKTLFPAYLDAD